ncbi:MAG: restriction endonuclease [Nitrospirae bacterium]|nr:restriction endonuclease [Candidatus Troglogloeales bacterium]MBI3597990.1 restriction endonuclease [Candidatus Troglogloeales bacterium]
MSYLVIAVIVLVALLSLIAIFGEAREAIKTGQRRVHKAEKERLIANAVEMKCQLHKIDPASFQKLVVNVYEEIGYRTKILTVGKEEAILLEQNGIYTLMAYKNHAWPISRETLETLYYHKTKMGLDGMMVISTGGFNVSAWEWSKDQQGVHLINEEDFVDLCNEIAMPL